MNDELTHTVTVEVHGNYVRGPKTHCRVSIGGDGGIEHMVDAFAAALLAAGFTVETVEKFHDALVD